MKTVNTTEKKQKYIDQDGKTVYYYPSDVAKAVNASDEAVKFIQSFFNE